MTNIQEFVNGSETGGSVKGTATKVGKARTAGNFMITDVVLDDGTGEIPIAFFDIETPPKVGDMVYVSQVYVKEFKGDKQLSVKKGSEINIKPSSGGGNKNSGSESKDKSTKGSGSTGSGGKNSGSDGDGWAKASATIVMALDEVKCGIVEAIRGTKVAILEQLKIIAGIKKSQITENAQSDDAGQSEPQEG